LGSTRRADFPAGTVIVAEGDRGKGFYVIEKGTATVTVEGLERTTLAAGAYFGEVAVIDGGPRSATIIAATRVSGLEIAPNTFRKLLDEDPTIAAAIAEQLRARLDRSGGAIAGREAANPDRATLEDLCRQLRATENADWAQGQMVQRRGLQRLFARA
jgi:CRP-like cAMP-binding protein